MARTLAAVVVLLALAVSAGAAVIHTDDGCAVEIHCVACRQGFASTADVAALPAAATRLSPDPLPPPPARRLPESTAPLHVALRGPPLA